MRETSMFTFPDSESKVCWQKRQLKAANAKASTNNSILRSEYLKKKYKKLLCKQLQNWFILEEVVEDSQLGHSFPADPSWFTQANR